MATKKLLPVSANNPPIPAPPVPVIPGLTPTTTTTTTTTVPPSQPKPSKPSTGKLVPSNKKSTKTRYGTVEYEQLPGDILTRIRTEGKTIGGLVLNAPVGLANFLVGGAIDVGKAGIDVAAKAVGADYDPGIYRTTQELYESVGRTKDLLGKTLRGGATVSSLVGTVTPSGVAKAIEQEPPSLPEHYVAALKANQSILPFIIEDFGNISMAGSLYSGLAKAGVRGVTLGEAAAQAERATAAQLLDEAIPGTAEAAAAAERLAKAEARVNRVNNAKTFFTENMKIGKDIERLANKVGALPFKPYAYGTRKALSLYRDGIYLGENGRYARWGAKASRGYAEQAQRLVDDGVSPDDPRVVELINKSVKAGRRATSREVMKQVREAGRDAENESGSAVRALIDQIKEPLHKEVINPETNEAYGELSPDEAAAVLAIQGGNAQIINRIASRYNVPPKILALLGRYDFYQEYSLSERAAQLASDFLDFNPEAPGRMTIEQYERLANAAENVAQTVFKAMIERAAKGYGRRNPLPAEQLVPTPFVDRLERNIIESIKQAERALKKERSKKKVDRAEAMRLQQIANDRLAVFESWQQIKETGVLELPVDHPDRIAILKGFVDQLPMELALDPSMYSAAMRVPLEFYRRLRRGMAAAILDDGGPDIVPEGDGGPKLTPPKFTKEGAVEAELSKRKKRVKAIENKIDSIVEKLDKKEAQHAKLVERIVRYDIVDAYIAGSTPADIARDFSLDVAIVEEVLKSSQAARTYRRSIDLKAKADEARSRLTPEEINAMPELMAEAERLAEEANAAQAEYQRIVQLAEQERQQIEAEADRLNEELYDLEEEMGDYEDAYEKAGGVVDDLWDPADGTTADKGLAVYNVLRDVHTEMFDNKTEVGTFEIGSGGYWATIKGKKRKKNSPTVSFSIAMGREEPISIDGFVAGVEDGLRAFVKDFEAVSSGKKDSASTGTQGGILVSYYISGKPEGLNVEDAVTFVNDIVASVRNKYGETTPSRQIESPPAIKPVPESSSLFKQLGPTYEGLRKTDAASFEKDFNSFEQLVAPQAGWKRGDVELYRPSDIPGDKQIQERFLPYVKSEKYASTHYLYSFYNDNPNSIILAIDASEKNSVPHAQPIFIAVPETWQEFVEILKKEIDFEATGKWKTAQNKLKKILAIAEAQVAKGETTIYRRDKAAASIPNEKQLELVKDYIHHYNRVRDMLAEYRKDSKKAVAKKESKETLDRYARDIETSQTELANYKKQIEDAYPFIDAEKLLDLYKDFTFFDDPLSAYENIDTEAVELLDPKSVIQPYGDQYPETLSADEYNALKPFRKVFDTGEFVKEYKEAGSTVYVNLGVTYNNNNPSPTGEVQKWGVELYFEATTGINTPPLRVSISNRLTALEVQSTIDDLLYLRDDIEAGEDFLDVENMQIEAEYPYGMDDQQRVQAIREIDLMIKAIRDVFSGKSDAPQTKPTPALKPVTPTPEPVSSLRKPSDTTDFATPQSVIDKQLEKLGDTLPEVLPEGAVGNGGVTSRTGGLIKTYTSKTSQVDVNVAATYIGFKEAKPNTKGLLFTAKDKNLDLDVFEVYITGDYQENKFAAAIKLFTKMRDVLESGELQDYNPSGFSGAEIELINPDLLTLEQIDLMIDAINDAATGGLDTQQVETAPSLKPVPAVSEPAVAEFTSEDAKNLVAKIVHTDFGIEGVDIDNLAYKHWRTEPFELDPKKTSKNQIDNINEGIKSSPRVVVHYDVKNNVVYFSDGYTLYPLDKAGLAYITSLGIDKSGIWVHKGPKNRKPRAGEFDYGSDNPIPAFLKTIPDGKTKQPIQYLYRLRLNNGTNTLVYKDPVTGDVVQLDEDYVRVFGPNAQFYYARTSAGRPGPVRVEYNHEGSKVGAIMPLRNPPSETPPTMVERMRNFAVELRASKISPKKTNYRSVSSIADAIEKALPKEAPAEVAVPEKPALAPPPAPKPKPLRPKATKPSEVKPDTVIKDPVVREAVYTTEVVDSMAAEAAAKMDAAQTAKEKLKAFQEWLDASKKYDAEIARLAIELDPSRNARLEKEKLEKKIAELREIIGELPEALEAAEASVERLVSNPLYPAYMGLDKMLPLDVALSGNFPADIGGFELPIGPEGEGVRLIGPMYYPSGVPQKFYGGIEREVTRSGFRGYQRLASEHYRDGDRHVIFSLRQVALRMQREIRQMVMNERFRAIIASIGSTASEILGEDFTQSLYDQAVLWADSMPQDALYVRFRSMMAESLGENAPVSGIASPGPGVRSQARVRQWAINFRYGELIGDAMRARGYEAINPFADIERAIAAQNIKAKKAGDVEDGPADAISLSPDDITQETMFLPNGMKEKMLEVIVPKDSGRFAQFLKGAQKVTSFFKVGTLVFSIPWQVGDLVSGMIISTMSGVDPRVLIHYMKQIKVEEYGTGIPGLKRMISPNADYTDFRRGPFARLAGESGVQNLGASMQERAYLYGEELQPERGFIDRISGGRLRFISEGAKAVTGVSFKINETINKITRHAFFLEQLDLQLRKRGQTLESIRNVENWQNDAELKKAVFDAARSANEWLGDYANLTIAERKYFQPIFPFWAWIRHIHHVFDLIAVNNPESLFYYMYLGTLASAEEEDPLNLRKGGFSIFGGVASSNWLNPFADVFNGPIGAALLEQDLRPFGSSMGPVPRLVGGAVGFDVSRFGALKRPVGTGGYSESGEQTSRSVLPLIGGSIGETIGFTAQQFPIAQRLLNLNPTPFENIPGTRVALGPVARYQTGEARLSPRTGQRIVQPGGRLASTLRIFGGPLVPYRSDQQINDVLMAARQKLLTLDELQRMRELQGAP